MNDLINISVGDAAMTALLGYAVVFIGLIALMCVILIEGKISVSSKKKAEDPCDVRRRPYVQERKAQGGQGSRSCTCCTCRTGSRSRHCRRTEAL